MTDCPMTIRLGRDRRQANSVVNMNVQHRYGDAGATWRKAAVRETPARQGDIEPKGWQACQDMQA